MEPAYYMYVCMPYMYLPNPSLFPQHVSHVMVRNTFFAWVHYSLCNTTKNSLPLSHMYVGTFIFFFSFFSFFASFFFSPVAFVGWGLRQLVTCIDAGRVLEYLH